MPVFEIRAESAIGLLDFKVAFQDDPHAREDLSRARIRAQEALVDKGYADRMSTFEWRGSVVFIDREVSHGEPHPKRLPGQEYHRSMVPLSPKAPFPLWRDWSRMGAPLPRNRPLRRKVLDALAGAEA
jgi:hypothetical protein